jgi:hypothetical protein
MDENLVMNSGRGGRRNPDAWPRRESPDHSHALQVDLENNEALADKLKEKARLGQWTMDEKLGLFEIGKKVEEDGACASVGGKPTSTLWQVVAAEVEIQLPGRGAAAQSHYYDYLKNLARFEEECTRRRTFFAKNVLAGEFDALAVKLKIKGSSFGERARTTPSPAAPEFSSETELRRLETNRKRCIRRRNAI